MSERSLAELLAEEAQKKEAREAKARAEREKRRREREAMKDREPDALVPVRSQAVPAPAARPPPDPDSLSRTERAYLQPAMRGTLHPDDIPLEVLRGLLYFFEGRINWKKDKLELRRELKRYLKYDDNVSRLVKAIRDVAA